MSGMSESHSKEQLINYVKKAKLKIKKLEQELDKLKEASNSEKGAKLSSSEQSLTRR